MNLFKKKFVKRMVFAATVLSLLCALLHFSACGTNDPVPDDGDEDKTPPAEVTGVNGVSENSRIILTWTDPADNDLNKIQITRTPGNATAEAGKGAQTAIVTGLTNGTAYSFTLKTVDISGNVSAGVTAGPYTPNDNGDNDDNGNRGTHPIPQELETIPEAYYQAANQQGALVELTYETYESRTYEQKSRKLTKRAIVYLPYGYSGENRYNAFYLMHGGWANETSTLGTPGRSSVFKNILDNAIENGRIHPLIIICPTYNNTSSEDSGNFSLALELTRNYHNELLNDLIPAIESTYSTFAQSSSPDNLKASRDHRGFGGFSMGSVATWRTFQYCLDYFRYFLPMSCGTSLDEDNIFAAAGNHDKDDFFVWIITGTADFAYSYDNNRVNRMRNSPYFTEANNERDGNFAYRVKDGYAHDGRASTEYTYNGLRWFWNEDE
jgi:hypothetical protein